MTLEFIFKLIQFKYFRCRKKVMKYFATKYKTISKNIEIFQ